MGLALLVFLISAGVLGGEPGFVGSAFADVYDGFAPLMVLHRAYADYLFYGTEFDLPEALDIACDTAGYALAMLQVHLVTQTGSEGLAAAPWIARVRADLALFCERHAQILAAASVWETPDIEALALASDDGFFSDIYALQGGLQSAFEGYLNALVHAQDTWEFGVSFSLRTLLAFSAVEQVDVTLRAILHGGEQAMQPPASVPEDIALAIEQLLAFSGIPLQDEEREHVRQLAHLIYRYVMD